jgi:transposase
MEKSNALEAKNEVRLCILNECWELLGPEIEKAKRSKAGSPPKQSVRDFMEAVIWVIRVGAPWRDLPAELGKWHTVYTRYRRWEAAGIWKRLWKSLNKESLEDAVIYYIDSTTVRAHQHAAGAPGKTAEEAAIGRSRGGLTTKIHVAALDEKHTAVIQITPGQASDCVQFRSIHQELPEENVIEHAAGDKGYDTNEIRALLAEEGIEPVIPGRSNRTQTIVYDKTKYKERNRIERFFNKLKHFRRIATRYEKHSFTFLAMIHIAAAFIAVRN